MDTNPYPLLVTTAQCQLTKPPPCTRSPSQTPSPPPPASFSSIVSAACPCPPLSCTLVCFVRLQPYSVARPAWQCAILLFVVAGGILHSQELASYWANPVYAWTRNLVLLCSTLSALVLGLALMTVTLLRVSAGL
jgi:hypothetical protein